MFKCKSIFCFFVFNKNSRNHFSGSFNKNNNRSCYKNQTLNRNPKSFGFKNSNSSSWQALSISIRLKIQYQICNKFGHTVLNCWHRYESSSQTSISTIISMPISRKFRHYFFTGTLFPLSLIPYCIQTVMLLTTSWMIHTISPPRQST